ncbi:MAG: shikimate dehydrogenase [Desulfosalsimonas sp.]
MTQAFAHPVPIDAATELYGVIGHPVAHSKSPVMHNRAFAETGYPGIYAAFDVTDPAGAAAGIRALGIRGVSVTIPHKVAVMAFLEEIDDQARAIGAVNTIVNDQGRLIGHNTDGEGAVQALLEHIRLSGKTVVVLGAGGAARAVGHGLCSHGGTRVIFANRTEQKARYMAQDLGAEFVPMAGLENTGFDILINTTPVGMHPHTEAMAVAESVLRPNLVVMDIVYNPLETMLLKRARDCGCTVIDGVGMFVYQGARQFSLWTGLEPPIAQMRQAVYEALNPLDN